VAAEAKAAAEAAEKEKAAKEKAERGEAGSDDIMPGEPVSVVLPTGGIKKGETPQQYIARTVDLDLGDF
jgi:RNA polymerase-associated protein RTF1